MASNAENRGVVIDLTGQRFGRWTVMARAERKGANARWRCRCECGNEKDVYGNNLRRGVSVSCGCFRNEQVSKAQRAKLEGQVFGRLLVVEQADVRGNAAYWRCLCECGGIKEVPTESLTSGATSSCGCLNREITSARSRSDITGRRFGRLEAYERTPDGKCLCLCDCGNEAVVAVAHLTTGHTSSCGCLHARKGPEHHSWDASISEAERAIRAQRWRTRQITAWRRAVYARDGHRCVKCDAAGVALNAHHLDGFDWCIDGRYDPTNGVALCVPCHRGYHAAFGQRRANSADFLRFLDVPGLISRPTEAPLFPPISE